MCNLLLFSSFIYLFFSFSASNYLKEQAMIPTTCKATKMSSIFIVWQVFFKSLVRCIKPMYVTTYNGLTITSTMHYRLAYRMKQNIEGLCQKLEYICPVALAARKT